MKLDVREIININESTPYIIIKEVLERIGSKFNKESLGSINYMNKIYEKIETYAYDIIDMDNINVSLDCHRSLRKFVNRHETRWELNNLIKAFRHMMNFKLTHDFKYGNKTNEFPMNYNIIMVYKICLDNNVALDKDVTEENMVNMARYSFSSTKCLMNLLIMNLNKFNKKDMLFILKNIEYSHIDEEFNPFSLEDVFRKTNWKAINENSLDSREQVIIFVAMNYHINIIESENPYIELNLLKRVGKKNYTPCDEKFREKYQRNSEWYCITETWQSELHFLYSNENLRIFVNSEGYMKNELDKISLIDCMKSSRDSTNVYIGLHPLCSQKTTLIDMDDVNQIDNDLIICIGSISKNNLLYTTPNELASLFSNYKYMFDPITNTRLKTNVINKLKAICIDKCYNNNVSKEYSNLSSIIDENVNLSKMLTTKAEDVTKRKSKDLENVLDAVIDLALAMRGKGVNNSDGIPIVKALNSLETLVDEDGLKQIEVNVTVKYYHLMKLLDEMSPENRMYIKDIQLVEYEKGDTKYRMFGRDITKKIRITDNKLFKFIDNIYKPDENDGCIRTNSNFILASGVFYASLCGYRNDISIEDIDEIR